MPPKTAAQKMRDYRARMSEEKKNLSKEKNRQQSKKCQSQWDDNRRKLESMLSQERVKKKSRFSKSMEKSCPSTSAEDPCTGSCTPPKVYGSAQSFGKAMRKAKSALPQTPRRKSVIVRKLASDFLRIKMKHTHKKSTKSSTTIATENLARTFYESDTISRQQPGRKDYITVKVNGKKERVQKNILLMTVMEAYKLFKGENPTIKIGKSKFAALRPVHVLPVSEKDHNVCCCLYHENFELLLEAIKKVKTDIPNSDELILQSVCEVNLKCFTSECTACEDVDHVVDQLFNDDDSDDAPCPYVQWRSNKKELIDATLGEAKDDLKQQLKYMKRHTYIAKTQLHQIRTLKDNLTCSEAVLQEDFSENFNIQQQDEIMSAHWVSNGVTLFTAVLNTKDTVKYYVCISNELHHDKYAVAAYNRAILKAASADDIHIDKLHIFTDGAGSQFKNRFTLSNLAKPELIYKDLSEVDWSFFATAHGKGPVDGVGGTIKRAVWRRILQKRAFINTPKEFANVAKESCPNINVIYVDEDEVAEVRLELKTIWDNSPPLNIPDTRNTHYFRTVSENMLEVAVISPFLPEVEVEFTKVPIFRQGVEGEPSQPSAIETQTNASSCPPDAAVNVRTSTVNINLEKYYAVDFIDRFYVGRVLKPGKKPQFWQMKFLHQVAKDGEQCFTWPLTDDVDEVHESIIFLWTCSARWLSGL